MATANPLEDLLSTDVDESEISALVGSLQSQLASPTHKDPIHRNLASSALSNHGDERGTGATQHSLSHTTTVAKAGLGKNSNELLLNTTNGNKLTTVNQQVLSLNSVMSTNVNPVNSISKVTAGALNQTVLSQNRTGHVINPHGTYTNPSNQTPSSEINALGSTNIGTINTTVVNSIPNTNHSHSVAATGSSGGSNHSAIYNLASIAAEQQPLRVPRQVTSHGQTILSVNNTPSRTLQSQNQVDTKPEIKVEIKPAATQEMKPQIGSVSVVNTNGGNTSPYVIKQEIKPQVKQEIRMVSQPMSTNQSSANIVSTGMRVVAPNPATSNITIGKSMATNPTVAVVRSVNSTQHGQIQIVNVNAGGVRGAGMVTQAKTNPRMNQPVRIAPQVIQAQGGGGQGTIVLPQGTNIPPGTMIVKNQHGQLMVVQNPNASNVQQTNTTIQGGMQKIQTIRSGVNSTSVQKSQTATGIHTIITGSQSQAAQIGGQHVTVRAPVIQTTNAVRPAGTIPTVVQNAVEPRIIQGSAPRQVAPGSHATQAAQNQGMTQQSILDNVRKCKNFLSTLIKLASSQPADTVKNVRNLIQNLIDGKVEPKDFTDQLQVELKSSPQPYLVPFLKKSLPLLRQSLSLNKMTIDGVRPPPPDVLRHPPPPLVPSGQTPQIGGVPKVSYRQVQIRGVSSGGAIRPGQTIRPGVQQQTLQNVVYQPIHTQHGTRIPPANQTKTLLTNPSRLPTMVAQSPQREKRKYESLKDDDDINDVATMGGVNLTEESRNILATNSELMSGQLRSCKDENFVYNQPLHSKILAIAKKHGLEEVPQDVVNIISHATQERLRTICEKLAVIAEHRVEMYKTEHKYQVTSDVKSQLNFLKELDKIEKKRHDEAEREVLLRAAKSRAKNEDPEQLKLKEKAKAMQLAELELTRQKEANEAALGALGPSKKRKMEAGGSQSGSNTGGPGSKGTSFRPRTKRVNLRDLMFLMEQERESSKSNMLYKSYLK